ncbi:unnamed protein product [Blepharisma stoltei]|uniref:RanBP2-type domain-containing protein n=1 Tax=Blepharisma stoltei TaxID=1481888 RepID=A0AAU9JMP4_9CILI|nr:unnamed protein product [Blepharisma stoltei]
MDPQRWIAEAALKRVPNALQNKKIVESNVYIQKSNARSLISILLSDSNFTDKLSKAKFNENDFGNQLRKTINTQFLPAFINEFSENEAEEVYQFIAKGLNGILPEIAVGITENQVDVEQNIKSLAKHSTDKDITVFRFQNIMNFKNPQNVWRFITASIGTKKLKGLTVKKGNLSFPLIRNKNSWTLHKIFDVSEYSNWERAIIGCTELEMLPEMLVYTESQEPLEEFKVTKDINDKIKLLQSYIKQCDYYIPSTIKSDLSGKLKLLKQVRDAVLQAESHEQVREENLRESDLPDISTYPKQVNIPNSQKQAFNEEGNDDLPDISSFHPKDEPIKPKDTENVPVKHIPSPFNRAPPPPPIFENSFTIPNTAKTAKIEDLPPNNPSNPLEVIKPKDIENVPAKHIPSPFNQPPPIYGDVFTIPKAAKTAKIEDLPPNTPSNPLEVIKPKDTENVPAKSISSPFNRPPPPPIYGDVFTIPKAAKTAKIEDLLPNNPSNPLEVNNQPAQVVKNSENYQDTEKNTVLSAFNEFRPVKFISPQPMPNAFNNHIHTKLNQDISPIPSQTRLSESEESLPNIEAPSAQTNNPADFKSNFIIPKQNPAAYNPDKQKPFSPPRKYSNDSTPENSIPPVIRPQIMPNFSIPKTQAKDLNPTREFPEMPGPFPFPKVQPKQPIQNFAPLALPFQGSYQPPPQMPLLNKPGGFHIPVKKEQDSFDAKIGAKTVDSDSGEESENGEDSECEIEESESEEDNSSSEENLDNSESIAASKLPVRQTPFKIDPLGATPLNNPRLFPKTPMVPQPPKLNQEQLNNIPQKFVPKENPQINPPKNDNAKLLTAFKNPEYVIPPPTFPKAPTNPPQIPKHQDPEIQDHWVCEFCTLNNPIDVYICICCAKTNDNHKAILLKPKP